MGFLTEIAVQVGWAVPVAIVLWLLCRRVTDIERGSEPASGSGRAPVRPAGKSAIGLVSAGVLVVILVVVFGWLITRVLPSVRAVDDAVIEWFAANRTDAATAVALGLDPIGNTPGIIAAVLIAATVAHAVTRRWAAALVLAEAVVGETSIFLTAQTVISRDRPDVEHLASEPATSSFPSGHVAATLVAYGCIALLVLSWSRGPLRYLAVIAALVLPLALAWSRMYQGMHHPSDVLVSLVFGPLWLAACWWAFRPTPQDEVVRFRQVSAPSTVQT